MRFGEPDLLRDGARWIIGKRTAGRCPHCDADPEPTVSACGRAEVWHQPCGCCEEARERNARYRVGDSDHQARGER